MSFIAEFTVSNPIMQSTRRAIPEVTVEVEDEQPGQNGKSKLIFWATGPKDRLERFFHELPNDPSLRSFEILSTLPERRLFRVTLSPEGERGLTYVDAIDVGVTLLDIEASGNETRYRAQVPSRNALSQYRQRCEERGLSFDLRRLYRSNADATERHGLTPRQRDVLRRALEAGYFEVPREISTEELAEEFDISSQALSALLRRGHRAILRSMFSGGES
ncbi:helix-turn-helix domain-containing protein [Natrinema marinum]|uniref:helix-turn-helix domain-containing protein n=1 Tax=Natrinema marinum TaxID=2961598 RepID=UPI0020C88424|nr:helix-turn-helix domain-containing protein [Natrinema marinum]